MKKRSNLSDFILLVVAVLLVSFSQPSFIFEDGCSFFAWFAYIPVFILIKRIPLRFSFFFGFSFGFLSALCMFWWLSSFGAAAILFVSFLFALYSAVLSFILSFFDENLPERFSGFQWIIRAMAVLSVEFLRTKGFLAFPYGIIGYSQWKNPILLKFASFFGIWGVTFFILLVNSAFASIVSERNLRLNIKKLAFCMAFALSVCAFWIFSSFLPESKNIVSLPVVLVQNASSASSKDIYDYERDVSILMKLTAEALEKHSETEVVVWPETAVVPDILYHFEHDSDAARHELSEKLVSFIKNNDCAFIIGNNHRDSSGVHNSALYFLPEKNHVQSYNKNYLVPFTEYWPSFLDFKFFDGLKRSLNCEFFVPGTGLAQFKIKNLSFSSPVCFEDSFPSLIRRMKRFGSDFFVNISDDAWAGSLAEKNMHLSMSVFRSAELASPFLRSSIDGITCLIDSNGMVASKIQEGKDGWLFAEIKVSPGKITPYCFWGDFFVILILIFMLILLLILSAGFVKVRCYGRR